MKWWVWVLLIVFSIAIKWASFFPEWVEKDYTYGIYPFISAVQRFLFGWLPFSVGDLFYSVFLWFIFLRTYQFIRAAFQKKITRYFLLKGLQQLLFTFLSVYVLFNLLWGLNYNRTGIANQLDLRMKKYSLEELDTLSNVLVKRLNEYVLTVTPAARDSFYSKKNLFQESYRAYQTVAETYPFLQYRYLSVKPSVFSYAGNILGFQGYYNPFSGEAQVNTTVPVFTQPFIACHEIGHQLGYAKENEANFAAFLACRTHPSPVFRYSVYFDMYQYAIREIYKRDTAHARAVYEKLSTPVKNDIQEVRRFFTRYENAVEPVITWFYSHYLKANDQPLGRETYSQVVTFLVAYQRKFGTDSL